MSKELCSNLLTAWTGNCNTLPCAVFTRCFYYSIITEGLYILAVRAKYDTVHAEAVKNLKKNVDNNIIIIIHSNPAVKIFDPCQKCSQTVPVYALIINCILHFCIVIK